MMPYGNAPIWEIHENPWDPIPGELPIRIHADYDLGVPYSWFEYEQDARMQTVMTEDQIYPPEDVRPFPAEKNPHAYRDLWRPQGDLAAMDEMRDPDWYPRDTHYNIYNKKDYRRPDGESTFREYGW
jgi:hypothetical protein